MTIKLIANYSERLGLPGFSSHQFSIEIEAELSTADDVPREAARIYGLLQSNVDEQIRATGFVPPNDYGMEEDPPTRNRAASSNSPSNGRWSCTAKQRELVESLVAEHDLDKREVERLALQRFGKAVRALNSAETSGLIEALIATFGRSSGRFQRRGNSHQQAAA